MRHEQSGLSLIELIAFIVIVSVSVAGILPAYNFSNRHSSDAFLSKQMLSVAETLIEEIVSKDFDDPQGLCTRTTGLNSTPPKQSCMLSTSDRQNYNDVGDYDGYSTTGIYALDGTLLTDASGNPILPNATLSVSVMDTVLGNIGCSGTCTPIACGTPIPYTSTGLSTVNSAAKLITVNVSYASNTITLQAYRTCFDRQY